MADQQMEQSSATSDNGASMTELEQVMDRLRRLLDQTFGGLQLPSFGDAWAPPVDVEESDDAYIVQADLPGVKREDVSVELVGNELQITGTTQEPERSGKLRRRMRRTGRFAYRVTLPSKVDGDKVDATLADGVLTVHISKAEQDERREIEVKS
jgi:HSP20 family protein